MRDEWMNINFVVYVEKDLLLSIDNEYIAHAFQNVGKILGTFGELLFFHLLFVMCMLLLIMMTYINKW